jgi:hypothetical protein
MINHIVLYIVRSDRKPFAQSLTTNLYLTPQDGTENGGGAGSIGGVFSTRRGNAKEWLNKICNKVQGGMWRLALPTPRDLKDLIKNEEIGDILFVITYARATPVWLIQIDGRWRQLEGAEITLRARRRLTHTHTDEPRQPGATARR